jgi:hypothetical protein
MVDGRWQRLRRKIKSYRPQQGLLLLFTIPHRLFPVESVGKEKPGGGKRKKIRSPIQTSAKDQIPNKHQPAMIKAPDRKETRAA